MQFTSYNSAAKESTTTITDVEIFDLHSTLIGVIATYPFQDATIFGVSEERMQEVADSLIAVLEDRNRALRQSESADGQ